MLFKRPSLRSAKLLWPFDHGSDFGVQGLLLVIAKLLTEQFWSCSDHNLLCEVIGIREKDS